MMRHQAALCVGASVASVAFLASTLGGEDHL